jgi:N-acetylmuramoyl-L-alanine amidase
MESNRTNCPLARLPAFLACVLAVFLLSGCGTTQSFRSPRGLQAAGYFDTVVIDAGHGGHDSGARAVNGAPEKQLALDTARRVSRILRSSGLRVVETRSGDYFIPLDQRVAKSNSLRNVVFVSIHYNWVKRAKPSGVETFFYSARSSRLSANIQREVIKSSGALNRGIKNRGFYVLKNNKRPAVLCELGFVSNPSENRKIQTAAVRQRLAEAVARGILAEKAGRNP